VVGQLDDGEGIGEDGVRHQPRFTVPLNNTNFCLIDSLFSRTVTSCAPM
jgi:hypothetical protein